jgi:hypothetical protein
MESSDSQCETCTLPEPITDHLYEHMIDDSQSAEKRFDNFTSHQNSQIYYSSLSESHSQLLQYYEQLSSCDAAAAAAAAASTNTLASASFQLSENRDQSLDENWLKMRMMFLQQEACKISVLNDSEYPSNEVSVLYDVSNRPNAVCDVSALYNISNAASDVSILYQQSGDSPSANQTSSIPYLVPPNNNANNDDRNEYNDIPTNDSSAYEDVGYNGNTVSNNSTAQHSHTDDEIYEEPNEIHVKRFDTTLSRC